MKYFKNIKFSTFIVTTACFSLLCASLNIGMNLKNLLTTWGDDVQMTVYLKQDSNIDDIQSFEEVLKADTRIGSFRYLPKEKAFEDFKVGLASYAPDLANDKDLASIVPSSFEISLMGAVPVPEQEKALGELATSLKVNTIVEEVTWGQEWVKKYAAIVLAGQWAFVIVGFVLLSSSVFVISNVIQDGIARRRREIEILELVGATSSWIRMPFLKEGAFLGAFAMISGLVISYGMFLFAKDFAAEKLSFMQLAGHLQPMGVGYSIILVGLGAMVGLLASWISVAKVNTGWAASGAGRG